MPPMTQIIVSMEAWIYPYIFARYYRKAYLLFHGKKEEKSYIGLIINQGENKDSFWVRYDLSVKYDIIKYTSWHILTTRVPSLL